MSAPRTDIAVTGIGLVTPAGIGREATWAGVCAGLGLAAHDPRLAGRPVDFACAVPGFDRAVHVGGTRPWQYDRYTQFALAAAQEAVTDAGFDTEQWEGDRVAVVLGSAAGGVGAYEAQHRRLLERGADGVSPLLLPMFLPNMAAGQLAIRLRARGPNLQTGTACASGATAIGIAAGLLRSGACDIAVAGGSDAMVTPLCASGFARMGALSRRGDDPASASRPFDAARDGFVLGEGAGVLVLERPEHAQARGAGTYALLAGYGASADARLPVAPDPEGAGLRLALRRALEEADAGPHEIDHVNAHGTSTPLNDLIEATVLHQVLGDRPTVTSTKGVTGHLMGAAGSVEAALAALSVARGTVPPTANHDTPDPALHLDVVAKETRRLTVDLALSTSLGFGGHNAVLAFRRGHTDRRSNDLDGQKGIHHD